jgi:anti-sigma B factor antagonist
VIHSRYSSGTLQRAGRFGELEVSVELTHYVTRVQEGFFEDICVVKASGRITIGEAGSGFRKYVQQRISDGQRNFIWDLSEISFIDSSGVGELVSAVTRVSMRAGRIVVIDSPGIRGALALTKLGTIFEITSDLPQAIAKFRGGTIQRPFEIKYEDKFSIAIEKDNKEKKLVVKDNISEELLRTEYNVRDIPPDEDPKRLSPKWLVLVVLTSLATLGATVYGLVWAARAISSVVLLTLIFCLALLFFIVLATVVLLLSGHLSEKTAAKVFGGVLGKVPRLSFWMSKESEKKTD